MHMLRTLLVAARKFEIPAELDRVIRRVADLYGARLIFAAACRAAELGTLQPPQHTTVAERVQKLVLVGDYIHVICDKGHEADVIVTWPECLVGEDGEPSTDELVTLVRRAPRPIWLFRKPFVHPEHILVAYDGSAHSGRALHLAANLAETLGSRLTVLNVDESNDEAAQELILSRAVGYCAPYRITMERVGLFGRAAYSIQSYAHTCGCHLLIVGAAGAESLRGLLFGSVAGELIAHAPCSVLVAK
jgi:nucleotide-binding universal stress UspA family protein